MATDGEKIRQLRDFFLDTFSVSELEMFLTVNEYKGVVTAMSERAGGAEVFFTAARALERRGEIDRELFERLRMERPKKKARIDALEQLWLAEDQAAPEPSGGPAASGPRKTPLAVPPAPQPPTPGALGGKASEPFDFDVFLSHSSKDKPVVRELAERLRRDGLKVWFDEWEIGLGDAIHARVQDGLERSRILLLFMSQNAFGSDWAALEHQAVLFRDPLNRKRRFIPLRLDDAEVPVVLRQFRYLDWQTPTDDAYRSLLLACRVPTPALPPGLTVSPRASAPRRATVLKGHTGPVLSVAISADGRHAVSGSLDKRVRVWDLDRNTCSAVLKGHESHVYGVAISANGRRAISGSSDRTVRVWDLYRKVCTAVLKGHKRDICSVAVSPHGRRAISGSSDRTVRVWDLRKSASVNILEGHKGHINGVAVASDIHRVVSGSDDNTARVWDFDTRDCLVVLKGHEDHVWGVAMTSDGRRALTGSWDNTVRMWDLDTDGTRVTILKGHEAQVWGVAMTPDGRRAVSGSSDKTVRVWDLDTGTCVAVLEGHKDLVWGVAVTPDGRRAVSGSHDQTVRVWDLSDFPVAAAKS